MTTRVGRFEMSSSWGDGGVAVWPIVVSSKGDVDLASDSRLDTHLRKLETGSCWPEPPKRFARRSDLFDGALPLDVRADVDHLLVVCGHLVAVGVARQ